jgi:hypothetical protein
MSTSVGFDRFKAPTEETAVAGQCACGCGEEIAVGYRHLECDGEWFYDEECLLKHIGAKWRAVG